MLSVNLKRISPLFCVIKVRLWHNEPAAAQTTCRLSAATVSAAAEPPWRFSTFTKVLSCPAATLPLSSGSTVRLATAFRLVAFLILACLLSVPLVAVVLCTWCREEAEEDWRFQPSCLLVCLSHPHWVQFYSGWHITAVGPICCLLFFDYIIEV